MKPQRPLTPRSILRYAIQGLILAVIATVGVLFFYTAPDTFEHLSQFKWSTRGLLFLMVVTAWCCNGGRVFFFTRSLGYRLSYLQSIAISLSSEFGITSTPAGVGGAAIRLTLLRRAGVPLAHGTAMMAMDVSLDCVFFLLLLPFAIWSLSQNSKIQALLGDVHPVDLILTLIMLIVIIVMLVFLLRSRWFCGAFRRWLQRPFSLHRRIPARLRLGRWKAFQEFHKMKSGFVFLLHLRWGTVLLNFLLCSVQWICRYSILPLLLYGLSVPCDPVLFFFLQGFLFAGSLMLVVPGGGGGVEVSSAIILRQIIPPYLVGVVILMWRFFTYHLYLLGGGSMFLWVCTRLNWLFPTADKDEEISFEKPVLS